MTDNINPSHYRSPDGLELYPVIKHLSYSKGNAMKYIFRAGVKNKDTELEDLLKAKWHLDKEIASLEEAKRKEGDVQ